MKFRGSGGKASAYNVGDPGLIPGSGRSAGEGNGNPLQYSRLENSMDGGAKVESTGSEKSWTWLSSSSSSSPTLVCTLRPNLPATPGIS